MMMLQDKLTNGQQPRLVDDGRRTVLQALMRPFMVVQVEVIVQPGR